MRRAYRPATIKEEALVAKHLTEGENLFGVNDSQALYAVRQPDGTLRFIDYNAVNPSLLQRLLGGVK